MVDRVYTTIEGDMLDLIAFREYGVSSKATEQLYDHNYRIADNPAEMPAGVDVELPRMTNLTPLRRIIRLWD
jgi:phage tail protein X